MIEAERAVLRALKTGSLELDAQGRFWRTTVRRGGLVVSIPRRRAEIDKGSYYQIRVHENGRAYTAMAHRVVHLVFHGRLYDDESVNHKDGNHYNNRPSNLEPMTAAEQSEHARKVLRRGKLMHRGTQNNNCSLTESEVKKIRALRSRGSTLKEIADLYGISDRTVSKICLRKRWAHV